MTPQNRRPEPDLGPIIQIAIILSVLLGTIYATVGFDRVGHFIGITEPKYAVGECVAKDLGFENRYGSSLKILEVRKDKYRAQYWFGSDNSILAEHAVEVIHDVDYIDYNQYANYVKVDCQELLRIEAEKYQGIVIDEE